MKKQYLGDSYDAVKRLWQDILLAWAPLHAEPRFIPADIRTQFTTFTRISILEKHMLTAYSILNDPDTGIRLPNRPNQSEGAAHITLSTIRDQLSNELVRCVITFDQSNHREPGLKPESQRKVKLQWLQDENISAFYYVSHAPFLFAFAEPAQMESVLDLLLQAGMPSSRIERLE